MTWIIGQPGWRFYIGRDWEHRAGIVLRWAWRERAHCPEGEMRYHFYIEIGFGRTWESVVDFGGPCWCPWPVTRRTYCPDYADYSYYSPRWTGRKRGLVCMDWPRLRFSFYRIPEDER